MKKRNRRHFILSAGLLILFAVYTLAVMRMDVKPIGPNGSAVGFAALNGWAHQVLGVNMRLYEITDVASIVALVMALGFALLGLVQCIKRKSLLRVDSSILVLGAFYALVLSAYVFFELFVVNDRPVLIDGALEASYPSSTTMLVMCIMPTAMMQFHRLIQHQTARLLAQALCGIFTVMMVGGRLLSGVHWLTDILGGVLLSAALVMLYFAVVSLVNANEQKKR